MIKIIYEKYKETIFTARSLENSILIDSREIKHPRESMFTQSIDLVDFIYKHVSLTEAQKFTVALRVGENTSEEQLLRMFEFPTNIEILEARNQWLRDDLEPLTIKIVKREDQIRFEGTANPFEPSGDSKMKYSFSDYNLSIEDAIRELDNFAKYGIDLNEKDHDKFFVDRWLKIRDTELNEVEELKAQIEELEDQLEDIIDEDDYCNLEEERDTLQTMFEVLKSKYKLTTVKGQPIDWKDFEATYGYEG